MSLFHLISMTVGHAGDETWTRPGEGSAPTVVSMNVFVVDIDDVNSADQTFTANVYYEVHWNDPRLAHTNATNRRYKLEEIWHPEMVIVNQQKIWSTMPDVLRVTADGAVTYRQQVWGNFSQPLNLREFPFDTQKFTVAFACPDYGPDELIFNTGREEGNGIAEKLSLPDWQVTHWELGAEPYKPVPTSSDVSGFAFTVTAERASKVYLIKVMAPLLLILVMASVVFWINPAEGGTQIGVACTAMLTLIAYRFAIASDLPNIPYLTAMDEFIFAVTILVAICLIEVVITSWFAANGKIKIAKRIDLAMRLIFPLTLAFVSIYAFDPF